MVDFTFLAAAAEHVGEHAEEPVALGFLNAGGMWALAMLVVIAIMLKAGVPKIVAAALDKKIEGIRQLLDEAAKLRKEAEALKAEYEGKLADAARHAEAITQTATEEAQHILAKAKDDATALVARRKKMAENKIAAAERNAVAELRAKAAQAATQAARGLIADQHSAAADKALVDEAIAGL